MSIFKTNEFSIQRICQGDFQKISTKNAAGEFPVF